MEPEESLTPRQQAMYDALEIITEAFGVFDQSSGPDGAHYMSEDQNPFAEEGLMCSNCAFYQGDGLCEIVDGEVADMGLCKLWVISGDLIGTPTQKASYSPPEGVRRAAKQALAWIADGKAGDGFTATGRYRAETLASGEAVSLDTIKRMNSFFARHEVDKQGEGWDASSDKYPSAGRVAWAAWGGDAGWSWAKNILSEVQKAKSFGGNRSAAASYAANIRWASASHGPRQIDTTRTDNLGQQDWGVIQPLNNPTKGAVAVALLDRGYHAKTTADQIPAATEALLNGHGTENIRNLDVVGTPFFDDHGMMIERSLMPQVPSDRKGEFLSAVKQQGLTVERKQVSPRTLKPIQSEINGKASAEIMSREATRGGDAFKAGDKLAIIVSSDGYIMDGHHRWAAAALHELHGHPTKLSVIQIGAPRDALMKVMQTWTDQAGVKRLGFGEERPRVGKALAFVKACGVALETQKEYLGA